jgi:hypothetical protein
MMAFTLWCLTQLFWLALLAVGVALFGAFVGALLGYE